MSEITPFETGKSIEVAESTGTNVFEPILEGFDWAAYELRQERLDEALRSEAGHIGGLVAQFHADNPEAGVMVNNLHNTELTSPLPADLQASLSVLSHTKVKADLFRLNFRGGVAVETVVGSHNLRSSDFTESVLRGISFDGTDLAGSSFVNAVLNGANFDGANLRGTDFRGAYLVNIEGLTGEQLLGMQLQGARVIITRESASSLEQLLASRFGTAKTLDDIKQMLDPVPISVDQTAGRLQSNRVFRGLVAKGLVARQSDFTGSDFTGATFEDLMATQAIFRTATLSGAMIGRSTLREADLVSLWAPGVILEEVDLRGANLSKANLVGAVLRHVDLTGIIGLEAPKTNLNGIIVEDCRLPQGYGYDGVALQRSDKLKRKLNS